MKFNKLTLTNIGAYRGKNEFDLKTTAKKNVILIGGENGAGKTTFLNAIKLGLFGVYSFGMRNSAEYNKYVFSSINKFERELENGNACIKVNFIEIENFQKYEYELIRGWHISNKEPKEYFAVSKDQQLLNAADTDNFFSKLKELFPPKLFDFCLFDGEEISRIINNNELSSYLYELSTIIFNLDLFNSLQSDLTNYLQKEIDKKQFTQTEEALFESQKTKHTLLMDIKQIEAEKNSLLEKKHRLTELNEDNKNRFKAHGGLKDQKRSELLKQEEKLESTRKMSIDHVKNFISLHLPFYINSKLLNEASLQITQEEQLRFFNHANQFLTESEISKILTALGDHTIETNQLHRLILEKFKPNEEITEIHRLSPAQQGQIQHICNFINHETHKTYLDKIEYNRKLLVDIQKIRKQIKTNDGTNDFQTILDEVEKINKQINQIESEFIELEENLRTLQASLEDVEKSILKNESYLKQESRTTNTFEMAQNIIKLSTRFQEMQQKKKLQQVQIATTNMMNKIMRKKQYISSIQINSQNFDVKLFNKANEEIEKNTLSAGEKEILLLSIIWAMFTSSGRRVPFIFDTLLSRLDLTHKQKILTDYIPQCGEQVLILATNSEINATQLELLKPYISKQYVLNFNTETDCIHIDTGYLNFEEGYR